MAVLGVPLPGLQSAVSLSELAELIDRSAGEKSEDLSRLPCPDLSIFRLLRQSLCFRHVRDHSTAGVKSPCLALESALQGRGNTSANCLPRTSQPYHVRPFGGKRLKMAL